jgi:hypothetical protein
LQAAHRTCKSQRASSLLPTYFCAYYNGCGLLEKLKAESWTPVMLHSIGNQAETVNANLKLVAVTGSANLHAAIRLGASVQAPRCRTLGKQGILNSH